MKFVQGRPYAQPEAAARKLVEIAAGIKPVPGGSDLHRAGQLAIPDRVQGQSTGVWGRPALRHRAGLVLDARVRNLFAGVQAGGLT
jgi:hypothetical protein